MSLVASALSLFLAQSSSTFDRVDRMLSSTTGMMCEISVTVQNLGTATGTYEFLQPRFQRLRLKNASSNEEFVQSDEASVHLDHGDKEYTWYSAFEKFEETPPESGALLHFGSPHFLTLGKLANIAPRSKWSDKGKTVLNGKRAFILSLRSPEPGKPDVLTFWTDSFGTLLKSRLLIESQGSTIWVDTVFTRISTKPPSKEKFSVQLPWGYVPTRAVKTTDTHVTTEQFKLGTAKLWPDGGSVALDGRTIVLLTSNDLDDQSDAKPWKTLAERAKAKRIKFVQVWLGAEPQRRPSDWAVVWDRDGQLERKLGPPVTPYVMAFDGGTLVSGWQGWPNRQTDDMIHALLKPFDKD